jgi:hypothetical protein
MGKGKLSSKIVFVLCAAVVLAMLLPTLALAAPVLADSYAESNANGTAQYSPADLAGQSFTAIAGTVDSAKVSLWKGGSPTGQIRAYIYALSGVYGTDSVPTGAPLATSAPIDATTLGTTPALVTFTFNNSVSLTAGGKYVLVVDAPAAGGVSILGYNDVGTGHPGNASENIGGGGWIGYDFADFVFYLYQTPPAPPVVSTPASSTWSIGLLALVAMVGAVVMRKREAR